MNNGENVKMSVPGGYILLKVLEHDLLGHAGNPKVTPVLYAETREELEIYCKENDFNLNGTYAPYIIDTIQKFDERMKEGDDTLVLPKDDVPEDTEDMGYDLIEVTGYGGWGDYSTNPIPLKHAKTEKELEEYCDEMGYDYKEPYPRYLIQSTKYRIEEERRKEEKEYKINHPDVKSVELFSIAPIELMEIFKNEDIMTMEAYFYLKHILKHPDYKNVTFYYGTIDTTSMEKIRQYKTTMEIIISPEDFSRVLIECSHMSYVKYGGYNITKEGIHAVISNYITGILDPYTGLKTYHGLINKVVPMEMDMMKYELFKFKITDTNDTVYYFDGVLKKVQDDMGGDLILGFDIQEVPTNGIVTGK